MLYEVITIRHESILWVPASRRAGNRVIEACSGGSGPAVRASMDGYTVAFVFFGVAGDGSLLVEAVTACDGYLESDPWGEGQMQPSYNFV